MADINDTNNSFSFIHDFIVFPSFQEYFLFSADSIASNESSTSRQLQREFPLK